MKLSVTHTELPRLLHMLHTAALPFVLLELTGPGWIVSFEMGDRVLDLSKYRRA